MRKENLKSIIIVGLIVTFALGGTYAFMTFSASNASATGTAGCFNVKYTGGQVINNQSLSSTTNYLEGESTEVVLYKDSNCEIYTEADIIIHTDSPATTAPIENGALKYIVLQGSTTIQSGSITKTGDQTLATVTLNSTATNYKVYIWVDSEVSQGSYNDKDYSGYIYAAATQTSTIK